MQRIAQGRTVFIIAHRLSTVRRCDRIITIERGRLVEDGTHDELIAPAAATRRCIACRRVSMKSTIPRGRHSPPQARSRSPWKSRVIAGDDRLTSIDPPYRRAADRRAPAATDGAGLSAGGARDRRDAAIADRPRHRADTSSRVFCLALAWACLGKVDIVASAPGKIIPSGRTKVDPAVRDRRRPRDPCAGRRRRSRRATC